MKRALLTAGAILILAAPAFAQSTTTIEKKTITKDIPESGSTVSTVVVAPNPPPPLRAESPPPPPSPNMVWTAGRWTWKPEVREYTWAPGKYMEPPRPQAAWVPGRWVQRDRGWVYDEGRWD